jgi:hypothetical protein
MEKKFSVNQNQVSGAEVEVEKDGVRVPRIHLDDLEVYKSVVEDLRVELQGLISDGYIAEPVAERVISEFMYTAFTQIVKINLR